MVGKKVSGVAGKIYLALICLFLYMPDFNPGSSFL